MSQSLVNMMKIIQKTIDLFSKLVKMVAPPPKMTVSEWADNNRVIPEEYGAEPGKWDSSRAPYQKAIMDAFTEKGVNKVVAMLAAQLGKSEILFNVLGRFIHLDPCPMLMVQPSQTDAEDWSKERFTPTVNKTPVLKAIIRDIKSRASDNTITRKIFPGGFLALVGSNVPSDLAKRTIRIFVADEVDRLCKSVGTEGDAVDLGIKRTSNFWNSIIGLFSTPTDEQSRINREYMLGSQEEWRHECPKCGEMQWVTIWHMRADYDEFEIDGKKSYIVRAVYWHCPDCGYEFTEQQMKATKQDYVVLNPNIKDVRSFHVNSFASPWLSWVAIYKEYLEAKDTPESLKTFVNTRLAEVYRPTGTIKKVDVLLNRREPYLAELPQGVLILTAAVDTQDNRFEYEIAGWGRGEERWGIQKGVILGKPDSIDTWNQLDMQLDRIYRFADGKGLRVARTFIDSGGHYTDEVYKYCSKNMNKQRFAIKGAHEFGIPIIFKMAKAKGFPNLPLIMLGVNDGKQYILQRLAEVNDPGYCYMHFPEDNNRGYDLAYFKGLLSERLEDAIVKGRAVKVWKNIAEDRRNEPLDLQIYNLACLHSIKPDWAAYERLILEQSVDDLDKPKPKRQEKKQQYGCIKKGVV